MKHTMSRSLVCGAVAALSTLACEGSLTAPSQLARSTPGSFAISFDPNVTDSPVNGSEGQLSGFDGVSLSYTTAKGSFIATFDNSTVFRAANLNRFSPVDPCRQFAVDYNTAGPTGDTSGILAAITAMSTSGCLAQIHIDKSIPTPPPIRSIRPVPTL